MDQNSSGHEPAGGFDRGRMKDVQSWRRSRSDRMVAGVCGGVGRALDVDPVLIRVVMAVLIITGPGVPLYVAAWLLMPDEGSDRSAAQGLLGDRVRPDRPWLWPAVIGGCVFLAIAMMSSFHFGRLVPGPLIVLALIGLFMFHRKGGGHFGRRPYGNDRWSHRGADWTGHTGESTGRPADSSTTGPAASTTTPNAAGDQATPTGPSYPAGQASSATQRPQDRTVEPVQPVWTEDDPLGLYVDEPPAQRPAATPAARGYRGVKPIVVLLTGLAIAVAWLAGSSAPMMLAIGLGTLGVGMLLGGFVGRTLALLPLGILLALGVLATSVFPSVPRDISDVRFTASPGHQINATSSTYQFDAGSVRLDLTQATFGPDAQVNVKGRVGEVVVILPPNVDVKGTVSAQLGEVNAFDQQRGGHDAALAVSDLGADGKTGPQSVSLNLNLTLGNIEVERG